MIFFMDFHISPFNRAFKHDIFSLLEPLNENHQVQGFLVGCQKCNYGIFLFVEKVVMNAKTLHAREAHKCVIKGYLVLRTETL